MTGITFFHYIAHKFETNETKRRNSRAVSRLLEYQTRVSSKFHRESCPNVRLTDLRLETSWSQVSETS